MMKAWGHDPSDESQDTEVTQAFSSRTDQLQLPASQFEDKDTEPSLANSIFLDCSRSSWQSQWWR